MADEFGQIADLQRRVQDFSTEMGGIRSEVGRQTGEIAMMRVQLEQLFTSMRHGFEKMGDDLQSIVKSNDDRSGRLRTDMAAVETKIIEKLAAQQKDIDKVGMRFWWIVWGGGGVIAALGFFAKMKGLLW